MNVDELSRLRNESQDALAAVDLGVIDSFIGELLRVRSAGGLVLIAGNGGSASTASHMANDLMLGSRLADPPLRAVALADNLCSVTATGNDFDFDSIFSRQIASLGRPGDLLIVVTASGNSTNIVVAVEAARALGMRTVALTGFDGGVVGSRVDLQVHVPTRQGAYGPVEDAHLAINHIVVSYLVENFAKSTDRNA